MPQLNSAFMSEIADALNGSCFTKDDFIVEYPDSGNTLLRITFKYKTQYQLSLTEVTRQAKRTIKTGYTFDRSTEEITDNIKELVLKISPAEFKVLDEIDIGNLTYFSRNISQWCSYIKNDLQAARPKIDPVEEMRKNLKEEIESLVSDPTEYFTIEQLVKVDEKFDQLLAEFNGLKEQHNLTKNELDSLKKEISEIKSNARIYQKGIWANLTSNKLLKYLGELINSTEGRKTLFEIIKKSIGHEE